MQWMIGTARLFTIHAPAALLCLWSVSCSQLVLNARKSTEQRPAANDPLATSTSMATAVVRSSLLSAIRQPVTSVKLGAVVLWQRPREIIAANLPFHTYQIAAPACSPGSPEFEAVLERMNFPKAETGKLKWLIDGPGFFPELEHHITTARQSINVQVFIFDNDDIAVRYADLLRARSRQVSIRVLFDDLGSTFAQGSAPDTPAPAGFQPPSDMKNHLKNHSKVRVRRISNPWLVADHTKLFVFDNRTAILGGMNIGREYYSEWHDMMVKVEGPIVNSLSREFKRAWRKAGPAGDLGLFRQPSRWRKPALSSDGIPLRILRTDPGEGRYEVLDSTILAIGAAKHRIWIQNPYLAHDDIITALETAARRGVAVRIILPKKGDSNIMDLGNLSSARRLLLAGAKIYRYPRMTHMKVVLCDGWASVGSANLDTLSMRINRELNLAFSDPAEIRNLEQKVFIPDFGNSKLMKLKDTGSASSPLVEMITDQL